MYFSYLLFFEALLPFLFGRRAAVDDMHDEYVCIVGIFILWLLLFFLVPVSSLSSSMICVILMATFGRYSV